MLASVVLEPETHHKLKKLVEDQKHQTLSRPSSKLAQFSANATSSSTSASAAPTPSKGLIDDRVNSSMSNAMNNVSVDESPHVDDDGAMSDRTAHLWSQHATSADGSNASDTSMQQLTAIDESALSNMSIDDIMTMQLILQREMERRARAAMVPSGTSLASVPMGFPLQGPSSFTNNTAYTANNATSFVDTQAVESRKAFKRTKSSGNESAFNMTASSASASMPTNTSPAPASSSRARTPQPAVSASSTTSKMMSNLIMMSGSNHKLDLQAVEREDPELLSVHSDVIGHANNPSQSLFVPTNGHATSSSASTLPFSSTNNNNVNGSTGSANNGNSIGNAGINSSTKNTSSSNGNRPVSRTNGAVHPDYKMLYGHRNTVLPCLSPMDQQHPPPAPLAQSSPLMDFSTQSNSRSSSRPPSRGVTLANFEDRLSMSNSSGRAQALGGSSLTAASLALDEAMIPIEAVNISSISSPNSSNNHNNHHHSNQTSTSYHSSSNTTHSNHPHHPAMQGLTSTHFHAKEMTLDQFISANRPSLPSAGGNAANPGMLQREISRGELVLSPFCAFDDISLGSQSVNSSLSSRQQRRHRRRESTQTNVSNASNNTSQSTASLYR
jgi:hypothetical protein